ncbi:hypothetical protein ACE3MQ_15835 [Paenibacillus lentus]
MNKGSELLDGYSSSSSAQSITINGQPAVHDRPLEEVLLNEGSPVSRYSNQRQRSKEELGIVNISYL